MSLAAGRPSCNLALFPAGAAPTAHLPCRVGSSSRTATASIQQRVRWDSSAIPLHQQLQEEQKWRAEATLSAAGHDAWLDSLRLGRTGTPLP